MTTHNIYGACAKIVPNPRNELIEFNAGLFLQRLLLFDNVTLDSIRLKELPFLGQLLGTKGLLTLLDSGFFKIHCEALTMGQIGQTTVLRSVAEKGALPLLNYNFQTVSIADYDQYLERNIKDLLPKI